MTDLGDDYTGRYDDINERFYGERIPDDFNDPSLAELLFRDGRAEGTDGLEIFSQDYCNPHKGWHSLYCHNAPDAGYPPW